MSEETKPFLGESIILEDSRRRKSRLLKEVTAHLITFSVTSLLWWLCWTWLSLSSSKAAPTKNLTCGNSTEEAKQLGCVFDVLNKAWLPPPCYNKQLTEEFQAQAAWIGYNDLNGTELLDPNGMSEKAHDKHYYTTHREHVVHCVYMWIYQHIQQRAGGFYMDETALNIKHTRHCAKTLIKAAEADPATLDDLKVMNTINFGTCTPPG